MTVEFDYTTEELNEAGRAHAKARASGFGVRWAGVRESLGWGLFMGMVAALLIMLERGNRIQPTPPIVAPVNQSPWMIVLPIIPFLILVVAMRFLIVRARVFVAQRTLNSDPALKLRRTLDADASRCVIENAQSRVERKWSSFRRFIETKNVFLLYSSDYAFDIVPKRAFTSPLQLEEFRQLLNEQIHPPTGGFPITPIQPSPPPTS